MYKQYPAKASFGLLIIVFIVFFAPHIPQLFQETVNPSLLPLLGTLGVIYLFILHLFLKTTYTLENGLLKIKCGFIPYKPISIADIKSVAPTSSWLSSPAPSLDRIMISYGRNQQIILSPKDKVGFAEDLVARNDKIQNSVA